MNNTTVLTVDNKPVVSTQVHVPSTWRQPVTGVEKQEDIALFKNFGRGRSFKIILEEWRIIRTIERDIANLQRDIDKVSSDIETETQKKTTLEEEIQSITDEIIELQSGITDAENTISTGRQRVIELKDTEIPGTKRAVVLQREQIKNLQAQKELLESDLRNANSLLQSANISRRDLESKIATLRQEIINRSNTLSTNADILSIKTQISNKNQAITEQQTLIEQGIQTVDEARAEWERLRDIWIQASTDGSPDEPVAKANMDNQKSVLDTAESNLVSLREHLVLLKNDLQALENSLIEKIIELDPVLQSKKDTLELRNTELQGILGNIASITNQIETVTSGISASEENIVQANSKLENLIQRVSVKEQEYSDTVLAIQQAQIEIVSNTNAIPIRELEKTEKESELASVLQVITELQTNKAQLEENKRVLQESRDQREANINTVSMIDYYPYEFLPGDDKSKFSTLEEYHNENITDEELLEIKGLQYINKIHHDSIPNIVEYVYADDSRLYGIYHGSMKEMSNADLEYQFPDDSGAVKPEVARSSGNGIARAFIGEKLQYEGSTVYRQPVYISKLVSTPGIYSWVACLYGSHVLCISTITRDDDYNRNKLIINDSHSLEINYVFNFFYKPFDDSFEYTYRIEVDENPYTVSCKYLHENIQDDYYTRDANTLYKCLYTGISLLKFTNSGRPIDIIHSSHSKYFSVTPGKFSITHNYRRRDNWGIGREPLELSECTLKGTFWRNGTQTSIDEFMKVTFEPALQVDHKTIVLEIPTVLDITQVEFLHFEEYLGRESDFARLNKEFIVNSIDTLKNITLADITNPKALGFNYINNVSK